MMKRSSSPEDEATTSVLAAVQPSVQANATTSSTNRNDWSAMFQKLIAFKEQHGHCNVNPQNEGDAELAVWTNKQRELHKGSGDQKLSEQQVKQLNQIGLEWQAKNPRHLQWETRFTQLQAFLKKFGHVQVPIGWSENAQLANWVSKQRQEYKNLLRGRTTRLDEHRIQLLNGVGFAWQLQRGGRRRQLNARKKTSSTTDGADTGDHSSAASADGGSGGHDRDVPSILPGEVLIGQGAAMPGSPVTDALARRGKSRHKVQVSPTAANNGTPQQQQAAAIGHGLAPLAIQQQQQIPMQPMQLSMPIQPMQSSMLASSQLGLPLSVGASTMSGGGNFDQGASNTTNNELLEILARNALLQRIQQRTNTPSQSLHMLGLAGTYPSLGFQGLQQQQQQGLQQHFQQGLQQGLQQQQQQSGIGASLSHQQLLAQVQAAQAQASMRSSILSLGTPQNHFQLNNTATAGFNLNPTTHGGEGETGVNNCILHAPAAGMQTTTHLMEAPGMVRSEESKVPGGGNTHHHERVLQQQLQQQGLLNLNMQLQLRQQQQQQDHQQQQQQQQGRGGQGNEPQGGGFFGGNQNRN